MCFQFGIGSRDFFDLLVGHGVGRYRNMLLDGCRCDRQSRRLEVRETDDERTHYDKPNPELPREQGDADQSPANGAGRASGATDIAFGCDWISHRVSPHSLFEDHIMTSSGY